MNELKNLIYIEKYRPNKIEDLIFSEKEKLLGYLKNPLTIPSLIFYSSKPGTGKTSTAKIVIDYLKCDSKLINASNERGIDTIREQINQFARGLSFDKNIKRCVFLDEADGLCLDENTEIYIIEGYKQKKVKIKEVLNKKIRVWSYDNLKESLTIEDAIGIDSGETEMYEVEFENGDKVTCSTKHPFFQVDEKNKNKIIEKKLYELKEGDRIVKFGKNK